MTLKYPVHDEIMHGAVAGLIGGILQSCYGYTMKSLHFTDRIFMDYAEVLILGQHKPGAGIPLGLIAHFTNAIFWGIIFVFIMKLGLKKYYVIKGICLGLIIWVFTLGLATLYEMPLFETIEINVAYVLLFGASFYGLIMSLVYRYFDRKLMNDTDSQKKS